MSERPLVIDLSNICCDRRLDGTGHLARWDRFQRLVSALHEHLGYPATIVAVADDNLARKFCREDERSMRSKMSDGVVSVADGDADAQVLRLAREQGGRVVSNDRFVDYRRELSWIDDNTDDFLGWAPDGRGGIQILERDMGRHTGFSVSRAAEKGVLKERGLLRRRNGREWVVTDVLDDRFRCTNPSCLAAKLAPDDIGIPRREPDGSVVCPSCRRPVERTGPRPSGLQLKLRVDDREERISVYDTEPLVLGRGRTTPGGAVPSLLLDEPLRGRVGRDHLEVRTDGDQLTATDLGSVGGTAVRRWSGADRGHATATPLTAGEEVAINPRDQLVLAELIVVERSGQRFGAR